MLNRSNGQIVLEHAQSLIGEDSRLGSTAAKPPTPDRRYLFAGSGTLAKNLAKRVRRVRPDDAAAIAAIDTRIATLWAERATLIEAVWARGEPLDPDALAAIDAERRESADGSRDVWRYDAALRPVSSVWPASVLAKATRTTMGACSLHGYSTFDGCPGCARTKPGEAAPASS